MWTNGGGAEKEEEEEEDTAIKDVQGTVLLTLAAQQSRLTRVKLQTQEENYPIRRVYDLFHCLPPVCCTNAFEQRGRRT